MVIDNKDLQSVTTVNYESIWFILVTDPQFAI